MIGDKIGGPVNPGHLIILYQIIPCLVMAG